MLIRLVEFHPEWSDCGTAWASALSLVSFFSF
jgi:hypothetical protein